MERKLRSKLKEGRKKKGMKMETRKESEGRKGKHEKM